MKFCQLTHLLFIRAFKNFIRQVLSDCQTLRCRHVFNNLITILLNMFITKNSHKSRNFKCEICGIVFKANQSLVMQNLKLQPEVTILKSILTTLSTRIVDLVYIDRLLVLRGTNKKGQYFILYRITEFFIEVLSVSL